MKTLLGIVCLLAGAACAAPSGTNTLVETAQKGALRADAGADLRVRQEIMHNVPGLPGGAHAMMPRDRKEAQNHIRYRPRVWGRLDTEQFGLYARLADEMREYVVKNGTRRSDRNYNFPDEVVVDNLYFEGRGLYDGFLDFRLGRQDLFDGRHSVVGLDRLMLDGAPYVGSRSCYADMALFTFHPTETGSLDAFALYDNGRNVMRYGNRLSRGRPMNAIHPGDSPKKDEWGGGLVWDDTLPWDAAGVNLPYQLYTLHKHDEKYTTSAGARVADKQVTAVGVHVMPELTPNLSLDLDGAKQFGSKSNGSKQAGGFMGYTAIDFHRARTARGIRPYTRASAYYLSGDRHHADEDDNDTAWDPMWARAPCDSELMQYGTLYGLGYWSNMLYTKLTVGADFSARHGLSAYSGPIWAAQQDHCGHADPAEGGSFKGVLSAVRYDFPILLAPRGARGTDRFEIFGHVMAELFNPGDYYDSSRPAYFIRWELNFRF